MPRGEYVFCELSDGTLGGLPAWMADPARVPSFTRGAPMPSAQALAELQSLLDSLRPTVNSDMATRKDTRSHFLQRMPPWLPYIGEAACRKRRVRSAPAMWHCGGTGNLGFQGIPWLNDNSELLARVKARVVRTLWH